MLRRLNTAVPAMVAASVASVRWYAPPADLTKLYATDFDKGTFPVNIVASDSALFAKFLFRAAAEKNNYDAIRKDFDAIRQASAKLPVFWERTADVEKMAEFKSLSQATFFTLMWMQSNGMLDLIPSVAEVYETYVNAQQKRAVAKLYVGAKDSPSVNDAKKVAQELHKTLKEIADFKLDFQTVVEPSIVKGFAVELGGNYVNQAEGAQSTAVSGSEVDYTNIQLPKFSSTIFEENIETEVLRTFVENMAQYDAEEFKSGV